MKNTTVIVKSSGGGSGISEIMIPLYIMIFLLAVVGNALVLATLIKNKRMRTVTNVYLLNLAIADILLGVFCMPFTLIGQILRNFVFGALMCKLIPYFQAVSVSVAVWTLVALSLERYFAICRPLKSRRWQTQFHAYKMIVVVWFSSLVWNLPILFVSRLKAMRDRDRHKCREEWPNANSERVYNLFLDTILLLIPLLIMSLAYSLIVSKLWKGLQREIQHNSSCIKANNCDGRNDTIEIATNLDSTVSQRALLRERASSLPAMTEVVMSNNNIDDTPSETVHKVISRTQELPVLKKRNPIKLWLLKVKLDDKKPKKSVDWKITRHAIRSNYMDKSIEAKKKVIRMLFVVVAEFFVCWAPLHVLNTWYLFSPEMVYNYVGSTGISLVHLLAYVSSCSNPITYCFMNLKFRQAFISLFRYRNRGNLDLRVETAVGPNNSEFSGNMSGNESTLFAGRGCRSEVLVLEKEERV